MLTAWPQQAGRVAERHRQVGRHGHAHSVAAWQVGSKNAAFFMGRAVKVCTKRAGDRKVHQLCIDAEILEDRYRKQEVNALPAQSIRATPRR